MSENTALSAGKPRRPAEARFAGWLIALCALVGAGTGALTARDSVREPGALPPGVAALVDGRAIPAEALASALAMLASDRREPLTGRDQQRVLERLIDEELLVESALAQGFLTSDRSVRDAVTLAMVEAIVADRASRAATPEELRASFESSRSAPGSPAASQTLEAMRADLEAMVAAKARDAALLSYLEELRARARIGCTEGTAP